VIDIKKNVLHTDHEGNIKRKKHRHLAIILKEGKSAKSRWVNSRNDTFSVDHNTYFIRMDGSYLTDNNIRLSVYVEGVSTPVHHGFIEKEQVKRSFIDWDTQEQKEVKVWKIKGLKFDSGLIDMLLNRKLADEFTKTHMDLPNLLIMILLIAGLVIGIINIVMWYM